MLGMLILLQPDRSVLGTFRIIYIDHLCPPAFVEAKAKLKGQQQEQQQEQQEEEREEEQDQ